MGRRSGTFIASSACPERVGGPCPRSLFYCSRLYRKNVAVTGNDNYYATMVSFNEIENVAKKIGQEINAEAVILFGSYARNQPGKHSDVDLLVIAESNLPRHKRSRKLHLMFKPYPFPMDILVYTPKEVEKESEFELSFISTVLREGKKLYG
jgi:predicted nucleotidyltransferase